MEYATSQPINPAMSGYPGTAPLPMPGSHIMPSPEMTHQPGAPFFPGPTPSPFPPSPMMPGPDMQGGVAGPGEAEGSSGHSCGKSSSHSHPQEHPASYPGATTQPYFHDMYQVGPVAHYPVTGTPVNQLNSPVPASPTFLGFNFQDQQFWKGLLIGAGVTLLVTNDKVQKTAMKGISKIFNAAQSGVEELKEKFEDIQAEVKESSAGD